MKTNQELELESLAYQITLFSDLCVARHLVEQDVNNGITTESAGANVLHLQQLIHVFESDDDHAISLESSAEAAADKGGKILPKANKVITSVGNKLVTKLKEFTAQALPDLDLNTTIKDFNDGKYTNRPLRADDVATLNKTFAKLGALGADLKDPKSIVNVTEQALEIMYLNNPMATDVWKVVYSMLSSTGGKIDGSKQRAFLKNLGDFKYKSGIGLKGVLGDKQGVIEMVGQSVGSFSLGSFTKVHNDKVQALPLKEGDVIPDESIKALIKALPQLHKKALEVDKEVAKVRETVSSVLMDIIKNMVKGTALNVVSAIIPGGVVVKSVFDLVKAIKGLSYIMFHNQRIIQGTLIDIAKGYPDAVAKIIRASH